MMLGFAVQRYRKKSGYLQSSAPESHLNALFFHLFCFFPSLFANLYVILHRFRRLPTRGGLWSNKIMKVTKTIKELQACLAEARAAGKTVGLVPTMGALHAGHASLVRRSVDENDVTVVSIFLNPTQFNDARDLERYPRTLDADCAILEDCGAQIAFAPSVEEIYPEPDTRHFSYPPTDEVMEGARRPGHFNGVCQIVSKLFAWVEPDQAYFGEKDFQQIAVIRRMAADLGFKLKIVPCPVVREADGLAMSSRNTLLSPSERALAPRIYEALVASR